MKRALVIQHVAHEGPGRIQTALEAEELAVTVCRLDQEPLPTSLAGVDLLVVMGGPMGVADLGDARYPFLPAEVALLKQAIKGNVAVLGVCLGAQLLAHALGARVYPNELGKPPQRVREVGWGGLALHHAADETGVLSGLHEAEIMVHWHGDTFDLPDGANWLASTLHCRHQMFVHGRTVGVQFHPELRQSDIEALLKADADYVRSTLGEHGAERIRGETERFFPRYREVSDRLLRNIVRTLIGKRT